MSVETRTDRLTGRLCAAIKRAGFSVDGFARRMGVNRTSIWRIDRGQISPTEEWAARAEALLAVSDEPAESAA